MDKNAIKKYAVWARRELIARVSQKAVQYGITETDYSDPNADSVNGILLSPVEKKQRQALISQIKEKGYEQVMEAAAYTWFNRFSALRFMEVNGYLPTHVRVFTDEENNFKPQILTEAIHLELDGLDMEKVYTLKNENKTDELYKYLIITQCNALNSILPRMFQKIEDYTELLFPDNILRNGSVIQQMIELIPEDDWKDEVQIIGWLYQYYNSEKKDDVFAALKKNVKITKENIPAATQLFTPDWIVRYMVENSLGRLWVEGHPNEKLKSNWKYYLDEAEQKTDVKAQLAKIRKEYESIKPGDIRCIDPCTGSGHILVYIFDVLMQIYETFGYTTREAVASIVENNIYGLDIDERAAQLAYFAVMMKARQYDRRFFSRNIQPHVYAILESNHISKECLEYFANGNVKLSREIHALVDEMYDAKEYGSILNITVFDFDAMFNRFEEIENEDIMNFYTIEVMKTLRPLVEIVKMLSQQYDVVVTNPPYMASSGMDERLFKYVKKYYDDGRNDLYTVFLLKCCYLCKFDGYMSMIIQLGWTSLTRSAKLRSIVYSKMTYVNMVHLGSHVFEEISGEVVKSGTFIMKRRKLMDYKATYCKVDQINSADDKEKAVRTKQHLYFASLRETYEIEGAPLSYWLPRTMLPMFSESTIHDRFICRAGMQTGNNDLFLRFWYEPSTSTIDHFNKGTKWYMYNKGGRQRRWYGNNDLVVNWECNGRDIKAFKKHRLELGEIEKKNSECWNSEFYFVEGVTWSSISSDSPMFRYTSENSIFDIKGPTCFVRDGVTHNELIQILGYLNSPIVTTLLKVLSPTLDCNPGTVSKLPYVSQIENTAINYIVEKCIDLSKQDWDSFETSWNFQGHPLISIIAKNRMLFDNLHDIELTECFMCWENECIERFNELKHNEETLNRIFIDIYGLQNELTPEVENKNVTVHKADLQKDIKSFISYAVGCMFGRYSLDVDGLVYAGGEWDDSKYKTFLPDKDAIIPISDDEYFTDDMVGRFVEFVEVVYGEETLEENLKFIADAIGGHGTSREVIRNYFLNDFYKDHCKTYQKRPIYWLFDSGKKDGFKALIYMHRYQPDTIARMRTDYVHEQQGRYRTEITDLETRIASASTSERVKLNKQLSTLQGKATEIREYEEKIHHLADQMIRIDLDDGVKHNYAIFQDVLAKIK
ncbi:BREX-1 system adenine-specific DNA-methyltransferase PglX [Pectinatus frisingensis]|uniref:BREX-1 system adenine-specific DNA-methyltransferase PglX n=1 Tax=Pectinatus frisingensis TaxID=865 RepID=UPI0018C7A2DC|nr:BREX-1 system adenine-specific DNA-methyltransferase PglX [Pectinatus frisingensis]